MTAPDPQRLEAVRAGNVTIDQGAHDDFSKGHCAMEVVAWLAGEEHTDAPNCACPFISGFLRGWNDAIPDTTKRTRLLAPLLPHVVGSFRDDAGTTYGERKEMAQAWLVHTQVPAWLRLADLPAAADAFEQLKAIDGVGLIRIREIHDASMPIVSDAQIERAALIVERFAGRVAAGGLYPLIRLNAHAYVLACMHVQRTVLNDYDATQARMTLTADALEKSAQELVIRMCKVGAP